jgi:hypothetical protein
MKAIEQFSRLIRVYPKGVDDPEDDHRVLTLFRNRAELKKAYGERLASRKCSAPWSRGWD